MPTYGGTSTWIDDMKRQKAAMQVLAQQRAAADAAAKAKQGLPYFQEDRAEIGQLLNGRSPYAGKEWGGLLSQLQARANGQGPSQAVNAYRGASQDRMAQLGAAARSGHAGAAQMAQTQQFGLGNQMADKFAGARVAEMGQGQNQYAGALGTRDKLNQNAYLRIMADKLGLSEAEMAGQLRARGIQFDQNQYQDQKDAALFNGLATATAGAAQTWGTRGPSAPPDYTNPYNLPRY